MVYVLKMIYVDTFTDRQKQWAVQIASISFVALQEFSEIMGRAKPW